MMRTNRSFTTWFFALAASVLLIATSGCGGGSIEEENRAKEREESNKLISLYEGVQGKYMGEVSNPETGLQAVRAEVTLYVFFRPDGNDSQGNPRTLPILKGRFRLPDTIGENDNEVLDVMYDEYSGRLILSQTTGTGGVPRLSINGFLRNQEIVNATVTRNGGVWGILNATLASRSASAPADGIDNEDRVRMTEIYSRLVGVYEGNIKKGTEEGFPAQIVVTLNEEKVSRSDGTVYARPTLKARYRRFDFSDGEGDRYLRVNYDALTNQVFMYTESVGGSTGVDDFSVNGTFKNNTLDVQITEPRKGNIGRLSAVRSDKPVAEGTESDDREVLLKIFNELAGTYAGKAKKPGDREFPVEITLVVVESVTTRADGSMVSRPGLVANYRRKDFLDGIGEHSLKVSYSSFTKKIFMKSEARGTGSIPGYGQFSIAGTLDNKTLDVELSDFRGYVGHLKAKKIK